MFFPWLSRNAKYTRIGKEEEHIGKHKYLSTQTVFIILLTSSVTGLFTAALGYWIGVRSMPPALPDWLGK